MLKSLIKRCRAPKGSLVSDDRGVVIAIVALAIIPIFAAAGLAIDVGRSYLLKSKLSYALDAAGLAAGRAFDSDNRLDDALMFFEANFKEANTGASLAPGSPSVTFDDENNVVTVEAKATMPTHFMTVAGIDEMTVSARAVIQREMRGMELVLVMDNTGSMRGSGKMDAMKDAATELVDILYGDRETVPNFWVGLVPYAATVNIGSDSDRLARRIRPMMSDAAWHVGGSRMARNALAIMPITFSRRPGKAASKPETTPMTAMMRPQSEEAWYPHLWRTTLGAFANPAARSGRCRPL